MTDEQKQKLADEYARPITCDGSDVYSYSAMNNVRNVAYLAGLNRGLDESKVLIDALEGLLNWAISNHEMPLYSEVIYNAEKALQHTSQKDD